MRQSARELRELLDELATIDWRHPSWWATIAATAAFERWPVASNRDPDADYLSTDGGPRSDTFMATPATGLDGATLVAQAVVRARAAWDALVSLNTSLPGQPLLRQLDRRSSSIRRRPLAAPRRVIFATPFGPFVASLGSDASSDRELVSELARLCAGRGAGQRLKRVDPQGEELLDASIAVSLGSEDLSCARHAHRRAWNRAGGPWLGLAHTSDFALVTTSHTVVDGYGHSLIAGRVLQSRVPDTLIALARRHLVASDLGAAPMQAEVRPLGVATAQLGEHPRLADMLYATGWTLERAYRQQLTEQERLDARFTPTIQVPIAPGARDDPSRFRRRVAPGLMALRMSVGEIETPQALAARLGPWIAREGASAGILGRVREAALRLPLPIAVKRRSVAAGAVPNPFAPAIEVLAGRACLSSLGFSSADLPGIALYAGSAPALDSSPDDPRGGAVFTLIESRHGATLCVSGTGIAGSSEGARSLLRLWQEGLVRARELRATAAAVPEAS